jgi:hypothetical protein
MSSVVAKCAIGIDLHAAITGVHPVLVLVAPVPLHFLYTIVLFMVVPGFQTSVIAAGSSGRKSRPARRPES